MRKLCYERKLLKQLRSHEAKDRIRNKLQKISEGKSRDFEGIVGEEGIMKMRVGKYRVRFRFNDDETMTVLSVNPRGEAYKRKGRVGK